jgi:multiple sugar transport system permease protein
MAAPLVWMVATALKSPDQPILDPTQILPRPAHPENFAAAWGEAGLGRAFLNSLFVAVSITAGSVLTSSLAAFAFARLPWRGRDTIFLAYLATLMIPATVTLIPLFILIRELRWVNTYQALILPAMFSPYGTFLLRQFFLTLPSEIEEAARMDGCGHLGVYWRIIMPLAQSGLAALGIFTFLGAWTSFLWPLIVTHRQELYVLPVALATFQEMHSVQWPLLMAGSVLMIAPMVAVFVVGQRFFVEGIQLGAVKG